MPLKDCLPYDLVLSIIENKTEIHHIKIKTYSKYLLDLIYHPCILPKIAISIRLHVHHLQTPSDCCIYQTLIYTLNTPSDCCIYQALIYTCRLPQTTVSIRPHIHPVDSLILCIYYTMYTPYLYVSITPYTPYLYFAAVMPCFPKLKSKLYFIAHFPELITSQIVN